jgi:uncharacterized membrane protein YadS
MIAVIPVVGYLYGAQHATTAGAERPHWITMVPWFIVGFAMMSALRTLGDLGERPFGFLETSQWGTTIEIVRGMAEQCLLIAMAAVGLTSMLSGIVKIGMRPFILGLFAAFLIGGVSLGLISAFAQSLITAVGL